MIRYVINPSCITFAGRRQIPTRRYPKVLSNFASLIESMTLSLNCKDAGDPVCTHTMYGETEEELLQNAKEHGVEVHGYNAQTWDEEVSKNKDHFRKLIKSS